MRRTPRQSGDRSEAEHDDAERGDSAAERGPVGTLHGSAGNQAVKELYERGDVQPKLAVDRPGDPAEREAERTAERVIGADGPDGTSIETSEPTPGSGGTLDSETESRIRSVTGSGRPLPDRTQSFFESRFDRDFSDVRVHTGSDADAAARSIGAEAFTHGTDVVFAEGKFRPETRWGKQLLAHELTHVTQQTEGPGLPARTIQRQSDEELPQGPDWKQLFGPLMGLHITKTQLILAYGKMEGLGMSSSQIKRAFRAILGLAEADASAGRQVVEKIGSAGERFQSVMKNLGRIGNFVGCFLAALKIRTFWEKGQYGAAFGEIYKTYVGIAVPWAGLIDAVQSLLGFLLPESMSDSADQFFEVLRAINPADLGAVAVDSFVTICVALFEAIVYGKSSYGRVRSLVKRMNDSAAAVFVDAGEELGVTLHLLGQNPEKALTPGVRRGATGDTRSSAQKDTEDLMNTIRRMR